MTDRLRIYFFIAMVVIITIALTGGYMLNVQKKQMANFISVPYEHPEWPDKKNLFDASKWLDQKNKYIKIDDFYLLNLEFSPLEITEKSYLLFLKLQQGIQSTHRRLKNLKPLYVAKVDDDIGMFAFYEEIYKSVIAADREPEYLYTTFEDDVVEGMKPVVDYFLLTFLYMGNYYEVELSRFPSTYVSKDGENKDTFFIISISEGLGSWKAKNPEKRIFKEYSPQ